MKTRSFIRLALIIGGITFLASCDPENPGRSVPNTSCSISIGAQNYFRYEAAQLAIDQLQSENSADTSLVIIPNDYYHAYLTALSLIYDATSIPQRDSVIDSTMLCQVNQTHSIMINTSGVPGWVDNWVNGIIPTGNTNVDNAIANYNLTIAELPFGGPMAWYLIQPSGPVNGLALSTEFESFPGVIQAEPNTYYAFYGNLEGSFSGDIGHFTFYEGWGDCPAGCFGYHQWKFDVDVANCTVTFVGYIN